MGRVKGSAGNMTGSKVYDKNVLRAKAFEVSNPNTTAQQTERSFFAQVADCCASVSEEQLRSLFGVKPKSMSRRNALTKQVSAAFTIDGNNKVLDFSKLPTIGNGAKVNTTIFTIDDGVSEDTTELTAKDFNVADLKKINIIVVMFDTDKNRIVVANTGTLPGDTFTADSVDFEALGVMNGYGYLTCATDGTNVSAKSFGSFTMKTRATN